MPMLETMKNSLVGKLHFPHSKLIDYGVHSISLEAVKSVKKNDEAVNEQARVQNVLGIFERLVRTYDQIDEQLHAGYFFYILNGPNLFISNADFLYPIGLIAAGLYIPELIAWAALDEKKKGQPQSHTSEFKFYALIFLLAYLYSNLPWALLQLQGSEAAESQEYCR
mmetsp:Transcript_10358/g.15925  ORF Transcript_10358/g.15925 Transcript_10358/m.15925 type:complete len:167 (-) Transcript_10358:563-1063(-)